MSAPGSEPLFDYALGRAWLFFALRSLRRHWALALSVFALVSSAALAALAVMPRSYHADVRILTARNQIMPALGNPGRAVPREADAPTQAASDLILRRDNLVALAKQTNLLDRWDDGRAPILKLKDALARRFQPPPGEDDRLDALVGLLEKRLKVTTDDGTVAIEIDWPEPQMAFQLVAAAQENFIEARHALEVSSITEAISILEWHATDTRTTVEATLVELLKAREPAHREPGSAPASTAHRLPEPRALSQADQELQQARTMLAAKQRALADLEEFRRKRLVELQAQLAEQTAVYAEAHPLVVATQESIAALSRDSPQVDALHRETHELEQEIATRVAREPPATPTAAPAPAPPPAPVPVAAVAQAGREVALPAHEEDASTEYLKARLKIATDKYQDLLGRIDGARIELDTARAAFKYRYSVIRPAQVPKRAERPKPATVIGGGLAAALLLAVFAAVASDLRGGRIVEAWQIERALGVPLLGEVRHT